jgi:hypothetical protein
MLPKVVLVCDMMLKKKSVQQFNMVEMSFFAIFADSRNCESILIPNPYLIPRRDLNHACSTHLPPQDSVQNYKRDLIS